MLTRSGVTLGSAIVAAPDGTMYVGDSSDRRVHMFAADGTRLKTFGKEGQGPAEFSFPAGLAAHEDGRVAVVDAFNRRIQIFRILDAGKG